MSRFSSKKGARQTWKRSNNEDTEAAISQPFFIQYIHIYIEGQLHLIDVNDFRSVSIRSLPGALWDDCSSKPI